MSRSTDEQDGAGSLGRPARLPSCGARSGRPSDAPHPSPQEALPECARCTGVSKMARIPASKSFKVLQDCTICRFCRGAVIGPVGAQVADKSGQTADICRTVEAALHRGTGATAWRSRALHRRVAVRYETIFVVVFRDRRSRPEVGSPSVNSVMTRSVLGDRAGPPPTAPPLHPGWRTRVAG